MVGSRVVLVDFGGIQKFRIQNKGQMPRWTSHQLGGLPHLQRSHGKNSRWLSGLPGLADRTTRFGGVPTSHVNAIKKKRDCMERLVTPPRRGTSPSRSPPPPCEQALKQKDVKQEQ